MVRPRTSAAGVAMLVVSIASACSGGGGNHVATLGGGTSPSDSSSSSGSQQTFEDAMLDFARCMRDHGVDMPDPTFNGDGGVAITAGASGAHPGDATFDAAQTACQPIMDRAQQNAPKPSPEEEAQMRDQALAFAQCMRDHDIDVPDPTFDGDGHFKITSVSAGPGPDNASSASDASSAGPDSGPITGPPMDPKFQAADKGGRKERPCRWLQSIRRANQSGAGTPFFCRSERSK